jgi:hypothetical protein
VVANEMTDRGEGLVENHNHMIMYWNSTMKGEPDQIVVVFDGPARGEASVTHTHHRNFPEIRATGASALEAADLLLRRLAGALDNAPDHWHRGDLHRAIGDVRAFLARGGRTERMPADVLRPGPALADDPPIPRFGDKDRSRRA